MTGELVGELESRALLFALLGLGLLLVLALVKLLLVVEGLGRDLSLLGDMDEEEECCWWFGWCCCWKRFCLVGVGVVESEEGAQRPRFRGGGRSGKRLGEHACVGPGRSMAISSKWRLEPRILRVATPDIVGGGWQLQLVVGGGWWRWAVKGGAGKGKRD